MKAHKKLVLAAALSVSACGEDPIGPEFGTITVVTSTLGGDPDEDGYSVTVGSQRLTSVGPRASVVIPSIKAGTHEVKLAGIADNCTLSGSPSRTVTVESGRNTSIEFAVSCQATGIEVTVQTTGFDQPTGNYVVKSGALSAFVGANGSVLVSRLPPGSHTVSLSVSENCSVTGESAITVNVPSLAVVPVRFAVACIRIDKRVAFVRDTVFGGTSILVASANGSSLLRLADGHSPAWSPDGMKIIYSTVICDFYYGCIGGGLEIMDPDTRIVSVSPDTNLGIDPSWSPDGKTLAFSRVSGNFRQIALLHVLALDGSSAVQLDTQLMDARHPTWSPDGARIVFTCSVSPVAAPEQFDICAINRDGTGLKRLTNDAANDQHPAWSPDGSTIAFQTTRFLTGQTDIALMTADGTSIRRLTNGQNPAWFPDGSRLVFARTDGLFTIGSDGSNATRLTTGQHRAPVWRP